MAIEDVICEQCDGPMKADTDATQIFVCADCMKEQLANHRREIDAHWKGKSTSLNVQQPEAEFHGATWDKLPTTLQKQISPLLVDDPGKRCMAMFYGPQGTSKTYYAWGVFHGFHYNRSLVSRKARFVEWMDLCIDARACTSYHRDVCKEAAEKLQSYATASFLVIDEFGTTEPNSDAFLQIYKLINTRWKHNRPTLVTTTQSLAELKQTMDASTLSRLMSGGMAIEFNGPDRRLPKNG